MDTIYNGSYVLGSTSALTFVAGNGISITEPTAGTVRIGNDETVLWTGTLQTTANSASLNESWKNFNSLRFYCSPGNQPIQRAMIMHDVSLESIPTTGNFFSYLPVFNIASNTCTAEVFYVTGNENGNSIGLLAGARSVNFGTATTGVTAYNATIKKIVGYDRKEV